jgi:hypothetical protein
MFFVSIAVGMLAVANPARAQDRGELLYSTHCATCHTAQMHWRASRAVSDWPSLKAEVRKWQVVASLAWSEGDVLDVARYLNDSIYHFEQTDAPLSSGERAPRASLRRHREARTNPGDVARPEGVARARSSVSLPIAANKPARS